MKVPTPPGRQRLYAELAWLWPIISPPQEYTGEAVQFASLIRQYGRSETRTARPKAALLHLGCGGGHLDHSLQKYFDITGVDLSKDMLALARRLNPQVEYLEGDMRTLRLNRIFDAVMIADSIDYMLNEADLRAAFQTAWKHLGKGGVFVTYAEETCERFENNRSSSSLHTSDNLEVTLVENIYDPDSSDATYEMTFIYLIRRHGQLELEIDRHLAGLFSENEWLSTLKSTGFQVIKHEFEGDDFPFFVGIRSES